VHDSTERPDRLDPIEYDRVLAVPTAEPAKDLHAHACKAALLAVDCALFKRLQAMQKAVVCG
jgi:hypothetical protein